MITSQLKSTIRGRRRMYSKDYDVKIVSSKLSDIFKSKKLKHDWSEKAQPFIEQIQATAQLERAQSFILEAEETIWISDEHASLEIRSFSAVMDDGETIEFDVTKFPHDFTEYHNPYDCDDEEKEDNQIYEYEIITKS